jgi:hypothetical protein
MGVVDGDVEGDEDDCPMVVTLMSAVGVIDEEANALTVDATVTGSEGASASSCGNGGESNARMSMSESSSKSDSDSESGVVMNEVGG